MFGSGTESSNCDSGDGPTSLPNRSVYIELWRNEVLHHIEIHAACNSSLDEKEMPLPYKRNVASSLKTVLSKNKLSSLR